MTRDLFLVGEDLQFLSLGPVNFSLLFPFSFLFLSLPFLPVIEKSF